MALAEGEGYYLSSTGLASPADLNFYGPASSIHDIWAVPSEALSDWSALLEGDADFENLLPLGVAPGCRLRRDVPKDHAITYDDVDLPAGRLVDKLRAEQAEMFGLHRPASA